MENAPALVAEPAGVTMVTGPLTTPAGTTAVTCVVVVDISAATTDPNNTLVALGSKLEPLMVIAVPTYPLEGAKPLIVGAGTTKFVAVCTACVPTPDGTPCTSTSIGPVTMPLGATATT